MKSTYRPQSRRRKVSLKRSFHGIHLAMPDQKKLLRCSQSLLSHLACWIGPKTRVRHSVAQSHKSVHSTARTSGVLTDDCGLVTTPSSQSVNKHTLAVITQERPFELAAVLAKHSTARNRQSCAELAPYTVGRTLVNRIWQQRMRRTAFFSG